MERALILVVMREDLERVETSGLPALVLPNDVSLLFLCASNGEATR